jgi:hypothetical protein
MNLIVFWRNEIPRGSNRIAGIIPVTSGFDPLPKWIQSEQSVVVSGYGGFVVNNIPANISNDLISKDKILQVSLMGRHMRPHMEQNALHGIPDRPQWSSVRA